MRLVLSLVLLLGGCASAPQTRPLRVSMPKTCPDSVVAIKRVHDAPEASKYKAELAKWKSYAKLLETRLGIKPENPK